MDSRGLWSRLRDGLKVGAPAQAKPGWVSEADCPAFLFKARWASPMAAGARQEWKISVSARHKAVKFRKQTPKPRLVVSKAS